MALVAFLRGVNVGGHRSFRPSVLAQQLARYDMVNIGATGTFVIRRPITKTKLHAELARRLPFDAHIMICKGHELIALEEDNPFRKAPKGSDVTCFVSILPWRPRTLPALPIRLPEKGAWLLRILAVENRFAFGVYRRHMKVISYLGMLDRLLGVPVTTRNWNIIKSVIGILKESTR